MAHPDSSVPQGEQFEFKAEMKQLLHLIIHSLYTHPEVFLRELISNAADALNKTRFRQLTDKNVRDPEAELAVRITVDSKKHTFAIEDTGIGMTHDELIANIGTIANSGTLAFLQQLSQQQHTLTEDLIGKFGVGFYSVFMVADEVSVETCSADPAAPSCRWVSRGEGTFTVQPGERTARGTIISFTLKESAQDFSHAYHVKDIIKKYSNFVNFPIYVNNDRVNVISAIWHKKPAEVTDSERTDFYNFLAGDGEPPLGHLHVSLEGAVNFKALVFIPSRAPHDLLRVQQEKSVHLYSNKVLIQRDCLDLLPEYLHFVRGVVDTIDLPLNVSREVTQSSPAMAKISQILTTKIISLLEDWAANQPDKYLQFYKEFGPLFKTGINTDFVNREKLVELLRFGTTALPAEQMTSLRGYGERLKPDQKNIYYLTGEIREVLERNPNLEYFKKEGLEVLLITEPIDIFLMPSLPEYADKKLLPIDKADLDIVSRSRIEKPDNKLFQSLLGLFRGTLKDQVSDVVLSHRLVSSPATLVTEKKSMDSATEKMMRMMDKNFVPAKKIMEINPEHPLIANLSRRYLANSADPLITTCIRQLYEGSAFIDGNAPSAGQFIQRMNEIMEAATK